MRCPHCRGEIPNESQFCGVCGQNVHISQVGSRSVQHVGVSEPEHAPSFFDLPVSNGARLVRVGLAVVLNFAMLGAGIALTLGYLNKRENAAQASVVAEITAPQVGVRVAPSIGSDASEKKARLSKTEATEASRKRSGATSSSSTATPASPNQRTVDAGTSASNSSSTGTGATSTPTRPAPTSPRRADASPGASSPGASSPGASSPDAGLSDRPQPPNAVDAGQADTPPLSAEEQQREVQLLAGKIGLIVERHQTHLSRCYENALKQTNPNDSEPLAGRINVHFSVQPNGSATGIRVQSNNTGSPSLAKCLVGLVGSWAFPSSGSEALDFVWPFEFQAP